MNKQITRKRIWALMMAVVFMLTMLPVFATETETEIVLSGDGTVESPYLVGTEAELLAFKAAVTADANKQTNKTSTLCVKLTADIALTKAWLPIAAANEGGILYGGIIDGDGHTISGMTVGKEDVFGLVGEGAKTGLTFKNLTIDGEISGTTHVSAFVARPRCGVVFENCINKADITGTVAYVGAFIGNPGTYVHSFTNCANYGDITCSAVTVEVGGFVGGFTQNSSTTYVNCANYGTVTGNCNNVIAGIAVQGTFTNCVGYGSVINSNENGFASATYHGWGGYTASGCYYRSGAAEGEKGTPNGGTGKTTAQFASGEVTYLLNGSSAENVTWGQDLENDKYPVYGKTDYPVYYIESQELYSNKNEEVGTATNPYLIGTEEQLKAFRDKVNATSASTLCAKLTDNIKLSSAWSRITNKYAGTFDGNGYTISGFSITGGDVRGFIGEGGTGLVIKNLTLEGTMSGVNHSAAFIGRANGATTIENCVNKVNVSGTHTLGGFVGLTSSAVSILNCKNYGNITATQADATDSYAGAFIGRENTQASSAVNCVNFGDITGLTGVASGIIYAGTVTNSYNVGSVSNVGGEAAPITHWTKNGETSLASSGYYIADKISGKKVLTTFGTAKTADSFASGEVTYLLNGSTAENAMWGQEIGVDPYPVYGKTDYPVYKFDYIYTNSSEAFGTQSNPYTISSEAELKAFRSLVNDGKTTICGKLTADITLSGDWTPMGTSTAPYVGIFDGDGYTISNLTAPETSWGFGLVAYGGEGLTFKNLTIDGNLTVKGRTGAFVGYASGAVTFENCVNKTDITGTADAEVGGFIGNPETYAHTFTNCVNYGDITATTKPAVGGFVGIANNSKSQKFTNCINYGSISGVGEAVVAGISSNGTFKNCLGIGNVTNTSGYATATYNAWGGNTSTNCYYLSGVASGELGKPNGGTEKTQAQFTSGEVAYLLNKGAMEVICGQDLTADLYPVFGKDAMVWYNSGSYSNDTGVFLAANAEKAVLAATVNATGYIAQYDGEDRLVEVSPVTVTEEVQDSLITKNANATYVKVFLWNENMKPLSTGATVNF